MSNRSRFQLATFESNLLQLAISACDFTSKPPLSSDPLFALRSILLVRPSLRATLSARAHPRASIHQDLNPLSQRTAHLDSDWQLRPLFALRFTVKVMFLRHFAAFTLLFLLRIVKNNVWDVQNLMSGSPKNLTVRSKFACCFQFSNLAV